MRGNRIPTEKFSFGFAIPEISFMAALFLSEKRRWFSVIESSDIIQVNQESKDFLSVA